MVSENKAYEPEILQRVQQQVKDIAREVIALCEAWGISYFAMGGTAIGAVRHGDIIPWDDDVDLGMLRPEYERFLKNAAQKLPEKFELITPHNTANYSNQFAKICLKATKIRYRKTDPYKMGLFVDIFPYDVIPREESLRKKQIRKAYFLARTFEVRCKKHPEMRLSGALDIPFQGSMRLLHNLLRIGFSDAKLLLEKYERIVQRYNGDQHPYGWACFAWTNRKLELPLILYPEYGVPVKKKFGEFMIALCPGYDMILRRQFGDYMKLPPEEARCNHAPYELDFGDQGK